MNLTRPFKLLGAFYKAALLVNLEYRANFGFSILISVLAATIHVSGVLVFFTHTETINGWLLEEMLIVLGLFIFFDGLILMVIQPNMEEIVRHIREGTMDFVLLKPMDSQFQVSIQKINIWKLIELLTGLAIVAYGMLQLGLQPSLLDLLIFGLMIVCGMIMIYSLTILLITSAFWFVQVENIMMLIFAFFDAARYPSTVFPGWIRFFLTFVVPIAFMTTIPAGVILDRFDARFIWGSFLLAAALLFASMRFWRFALRHYGSASS